MASLKFSVTDAFVDLRASGLVRPAVEKFAGAWLACFLVMARGNFLAAFSLEHMLLATICGTVGAVVTVLLLAQMDRSVDSVVRQATISAICTFVGDVFAHPSHFPPGGAAGHGRGVGGDRGGGVARQALGEGRVRWTSEARITFVVIAGLVPAIPLKVGTSVRRHRWGCPLHLAGRRSAS
jgi:hypothetical protein